MLAGIAGIHFGWYKLQQNDDFVPSHERKYPKIIEIFLSSDKKEREQEDQKKIEK